jgi:hypothetical protein
MRSSLTKTHPLQKAYVNFLRKLFNVRKTAPLQKCAAWLIESTALSAQMDPEADGQSCRSPAVRGWKVRRMHGARGGAPEGKRNGNYRHGTRTEEMIEVCS